MYGIIVILVIVAALGLFTILYRRVGRNNLALPYGGFSRFPLLERLVGVVTWLSFLALVVSGFWYLAIKQPHMTGGALMIHVTAGGIFAGVILLFAIFRTEACRFGVGTTGINSWYKTMFWGFLICALVLILTAVVPMIPWLGTHGQECTLAIHRWFAAASLFFGLMLALLSLVRSSR